MPHQKGASAPFFIQLEGYPERVVMQPGETVLTALLRAGLQFPFSCQTGTCGTCKCLLVEGDFVQLPYSARVLTPQERATRIILACRTVLRGSGVLRRID